MKHLHKPRDDILLAPRDFLSFCTQCPALYTSFNYGMVLKSCLPVESAGLFGLPSK